MQNTILITGGVLVDVLIGTPPKRELPPPGGAAVVDQISLSPGGCAVNTAAGLAMLDNAANKEWNVALWCRQAKDDSAASLIRSDLKAMGVDVDTWWKDDPGFPAKTAVVLVPGQDSEETDRSFLKTRGMGNALTLEDFSEADFSKVRHIHIGGIYSLRNISGADLARGLLRAKSQNRKLTVSLDTVASSDGRWAEVIPCLRVGAIDYFLPSIEEAREIVKAVEPELYEDGQDLPDMDLCKWFLAKGAKTVIMKRGKHGAISAYRNGPEIAGSLIKVPPVEVVDTTGAGDAFCAGYIFASLYGHEVMDAATLAVEVGSQSVTAMGSFKGLQNWLATEEAKEMLEEYAEDQD